MGIERFFNSIKKSYGNKIITKLELINDKIDVGIGKEIKNTQTYFPHKYFYLDFNSIIHNISQSISTSLVILYHYYLISNIKPDVLITSKKIIISHLINLSTYDDFSINGNIYLPDQFTETFNTDASSDANNKSKFEYLINFKSLTIDDLNESFFQLLSIDNNVDNLIIHKICTYLNKLTNLFPNLEELYIAIDGVPLYAKMIEQRKRRTIGYIIEKARESLLEYYKTELDIQPTTNKDVEKTEIYYNHYKFEIFIKKLKFNKNKISPATQFMSNLELYIKKYWSEHKEQKEQRKKINLIIDSYVNFGEGEKKIVLRINQIISTFKESTDKTFMIYSPDADVILLMLLNVFSTKNISIMRYDQQLKQIDIIDIVKLKDVILDYMNVKNATRIIAKLIITDIVMLFTILGNDFLPKLEEINTTKHIKTILSSYSQILKQSDLLNNHGQIIFSTYATTLTSTTIINWQYLQQFFMEVKNALLTDKSNDKFNKNRSKFNKSTYRKEWRLEPDQIVNSNAVDFYRHIFNVENMTGSYEPSNTSYIKPHIDNKIKIRSCRKYIEGYIWLQQYYIYHNQENKLYVYAFDYIPTINNIIDTIDEIIKSDKVMSKINNNLQKTICQPNYYFKPEQQLVLISPFNVEKIIDKKIILVSTFKKWLDLFSANYDYLINNINLVIDKSANKLNIYDYINCKGALYMSKCHIIIKQTNDIFNHPHKLINLINLINK